MSQFFPVSGTNGIFSEVRGREVKRYREEIVGNWHACSPVPKDRRRRILPKAKEAQTLHTSTFIRGMLREIP